MIRLNKAIGIAALSICTHTASNAHRPSKEIDYCNTIKFQTGPFDQDILKTASDKGDCRQWPIPLVLHSQKHIIRSEIELWKETFPHGAPPFKKTGDNSYVIDDQQLAEEMKKWPAYEQAGLNAMTYKVNFLHFAKPTGTTIISEIEFTKPNGLPGPFIANYSFYKEGGYAASYTSGFISQNDHVKIATIDAIKSIFLSMAIDW